MKQQLKVSEIDFDWKCEIATHSPSYYKWTQYLFCILARSGLVEKKSGIVYWDPLDKTGTLLIIESHFNRHSTGE